MRIVVVIQARMGSSRLPGKVLLPIGERTMLEHVVRRAQRIRPINAVTVATTEGNEDDAVEEESKRLGVEVVRGSNENVLERYFKAATTHKAEGIVRVTADCPLLDPGVSSQVVHRWLESGSDYVSNIGKRSYPRGLDTEIFSFPALDRACREATAPYERAHVTPYIYEHSNLFRIDHIVQETDYSSYRWTVDTEEDLRFMRALQEKIAIESIPAWTQILDVLRKHPEIEKINESIRQKELVLG